MSAANPSLPGINDSKREGSSESDGHSDRGRDDEGTYGDRSVVSDQSDDE